MLGKTDKELEKLGALITSKEIEQQPGLWKETLEIYQDAKKKIEVFFDGIYRKHGKVKVLFAGAGTSAYVGDTIYPYFQEVGERNRFYFEKAPTTSIVSNPHQFFSPDVPTILVSFARSGNSPESIAAVELGKQIVSDFYQITVTCASEGKLAKNAQNDPCNLLLLMPEKSNDKGFAMTGSFTCMTLTALLIFDPSESKKNYTELICEMGRQVKENEEIIGKFLSDHFERIIYLGSGVFEGLSREVQLKILELSAGQVATGFDSSLGFRHGPKSLINQETLVIVFLSNDEYTRKYDLDILNELYEDKIAKKVIAIQTKMSEIYTGENFTFSEKYDSLPDAYLALPYAMIGQIIGLYTAVKIGNCPDTPSPTGTVNRVVKGVVIHKYFK